MNEVAAADSAAPLTAKLITMADSGQHVNELVELEGVVQDVIPSSDDLLIRLRDGTARIWASAEAVREHTHVHRGDTLLVSGVMEQAASDSADHRLLLTSAPKTIQTGREVTSAATGFEDETDGAT
ncbi:MAG TPA: hypothetical protein DCG12_20070 [Planctomycetaceae bacterium]|nr:hypothetical protein [Planctomycetaceae bacterium]